MKTPPYELRRNKTTHCANRAVLFARCVASRIQLLPPCASAANRFGLTRLFFMRGGKNECVDLRKHLRARRICIVSIC